MTDRWKRVIPPAAGVVLVAGFIVSLSLMSGSPGAGDSGAKVRAWFESHHNRAIATSVLMTYGAGLSVAYFTGFAAYLRRRGSQVLAALTATGGILIAVGLLGAAGMLLTITDHTSKLSDGTLQAINQIGSDAPFLAIVAGSALATLSIGIASVRTQALPKVLAIITVVVGVVQVAGPLTWFGFLGSGALTLVLAGYLYQLTGRPETITMPDVPEQRETAAETPTQSRPRAKA